MTLAELQAAYDAKIAAMEADEATKRTAHEAALADLAVLRMAHGAAHLAHQRHQQATALGSALVRVEVGGHKLDVPASSFLQSLADDRDSKVAALQSLISG